ncbi:Adenylate cyclase [hydrothermal vent metagenome]|uniref:Adenylate cyclase n=1 Tax=hydrothermal vent metagenome TaxID=652676 RepID=A0A3B1B3W5_9ZZZZ
MADITISQSRSIGRLRLPEYFPIAYKLALLFTLLISLGMGTLGLVVVNKQTHLLQKQMNHFGQTVVTQLAESARELVLSDDILGLMIVSNNLSNNDNILGTLIYAENGKVLASAGIVPKEDILSLYSHSEEFSPSSYKTNWTARDEQGRTLDVVSFITPIRYQKIIAGHAVVSFSRKLMNEAIDNTITTISSATLIMILLGIIIAFITGKWISRPIHTLMDASRAIGEGDYDYRIKDRRNDEIGYLTEAFNNMASDLLEKSQVENAFSRFVSPSIAKQIMNNLDHVKLGGKHVEATVLFADIVGFTRLSENLPATEVAELLNEYFGYIATISHLHHGTIDKYMGDCVMLVFGVPEYEPDHKYNAVACALMIQALVEQLNHRRQQQGKFPVRFRIGINSGDMLAGNLGSSQRMQYTVVGDSVNLASRLHTAAEEGQIIITEALYCDNSIRQRIQADFYQQVSLRGIAKPVSTYIVKHILDSQQDMEGTINRILSRKYVA